LSYAAPSGCLELAGQIDDLLAGGDVPHGTANERNATRVPAATLAEIVRSATIFETHPTGGCGPPLPKEAHVLSAQMKAAIVRGLVIAAPTAALTTLTTWSQTSDPKTLAIAGATSFLGTFLARSGLEGTYDTKRQHDGNVNAADVGATPAAQPAAPSPAAG
jgi:hypothetical protein